MKSIRPLEAAGRLTALMPVLRDTARVVTHLRMRSSQRHPRLGTDGPSGRATPLRAAVHWAGPVH